MSRVADSPPAPASPASPAGRGALGNLTLSPSAVLAAASEQASPTIDMGFSLSPPSKSMLESHVEDQIREVVCALTLGDLGSIDSALGQMFLLSKRAETRAVVIREGGIDATLSLLVTIKPNVNGVQVEFLEIVLGILWNLLQDPGQDLGVVDEVIAQAVSKDCSSRLLLAILKSCPSRNRLVFLSCRIMAALMAFEPNAAVVARLDGGITTIVNIVHPRKETRSFEAAAIEAGFVEDVERTPEAIEAALDLLACFTADNESNVAALSKIGGFSKLSAVITDAMAFPGILRAAFNVFFSCTKTDKFSAIVGRTTPAIAFALTVLNKYSSPRYVALTVCVLNVLAQLSASSSNMAVLFSNKGADTVMITMKAPGVSAEVVRLCCVVLWKVFMYSQPPPFNLHEYDRVPLPYNHSTVWRNSHSTSVRSGRISRTKDQASLLEHYEQQKHDEPRPKQPTVVDHVENTPAVSNDTLGAAPSFIDLDAIVNDDDEGKMGFGNESSPDQGTDAPEEAEQLSTNLLDTLPAPDEEPPASKKKKQLLSQANREEARMFPELAGLPFDAPSDHGAGDGRAKNVSAVKNVAEKKDKDDTESGRPTPAMQEVYKEVMQKLRQEMIDEYVEAVMADTEVICPTRSFVVHHDALPTASSKRPPTSQDDPLAPVVTQDFVLKVQVRHVERLVNRGKVLNRVVYDVNKALEESMIPVGPGGVTEARRLARTRDMTRLGNLCDQAIAGQLRVAGAGKAAVAIAAARSAAAKTVGLEPGVADGLLGTESVLRFDGVPPLLFESRFECGNLYKAVQATEMEYDLVLSPDVNNGGHIQWYYFSVFGMVPGVRYTFNFINMDKPDSMYNFGMKPLVFSERDAEDDECGWSRKGDDICYFQNFFKRKVEEKRAPYYTFSFTYVHHRPDDRVYFAYCYPYTYTNMLDHLRSLSSCERAGILTRTMLCKSLSGNPVPLLTVTNLKSSPEEIRRRRYTVISARVHPGETPASYMMESIIDFLTGPSKEAVWLRERMVFKIVPMLNVDGVVMGNHRCNLFGVDLNRQYTLPAVSQTPTIYHLKQMVSALSHSSRDIVMFCDLHAHSRTKSIFMYGCENPRGISERIIPYMVAQEDTSFDFESCNFAVKKSKANCGRVVMWRSFGIVNSYTMESSFCSPELGPRRFFHFKPSCFERLGRNFCTVIAKVINENQAPVVAAARALEELFEDKPRGYGSSRSETRPPSMTSMSADKSSTKPSAKSLLLTFLPRSGKNAVSAKTKKGGTKKRKKKNSTSVSQGILGK